MKLMSILKKNLSPEPSKTSASVVPSTTESPLPANVNPFGGQGYETRSEDEAEDEAEETGLVAVGKAKNGTSSASKRTASTPPRAVASKSVDLSPLSLPPSVFSASTATTATTASTATATATGTSGVARSKSSELYPIDGGAGDDDEVKNLTNSQLRSLVAIESMKAVESVLANYRWKDELSSQISDHLRTELTVVLGDAVKTAIKSQLRDSVKDSLSKSFKGAFETTLVPAFQVGVSVLHNKLQSSFDSAAQSLNSVAAERREIIGVTERLNSLEAEVTIPCALNDTIM
jgi:hypothetical protein